MFCQVLTSTTRWFKEPLQISLFSRFFLCVDVSQLWVGVGNMRLCQIAICWYMKAVNSVCGWLFAWVALCMAALPHVLCYLTIHVALKRKCPVGFVKPHRGVLMNCPGAFVFCSKMRLYTKLEKVLLKCCSSTWHRRWLNFAPSVDFLMDLDSVNIWATYSADVRPFTFTTTVFVSFYIECFWIHV